MTTPPPPDAGDDRVVGQLQGLLLGTRDLDAMLHELALLATRAVASAPTSCGITLRYQQSLLTVGSSDALAELLDETQYRAGGGPCMETLRTGRVVELPDTETEHRWPEYVPTAVEAGLRCSVSLPLRAGDETFGALNVYGFEAPRLFGEAERRQLELFAAQASGTLQVARRMVADNELLGQMEQALRSRTVIDQALGIIMGQQRCTASVAFDLLRRESQTSHRRLRDVAVDLVTRTTGQPPEAGRPFDLRPS